MSATLEMLNSGWRETDFSGSNSTDMSKSHLDPTPTSSDSGLRLMDEIKHEREHQLHIGKLIQFSHNLLIVEQDTVQNKTESSVKVFSNFARLISSDKILPQVGIDEDGCVEMGWEIDGEDVLVIAIDGSKLHAVAKPGTGESEYLQVMDFDGNKIPAEFISYIPSR